MPSLLTGPWNFFAPSRSALRLQAANSRRQTYLDHPSDGLLSPRQNCHTSCPFSFHGLPTQGCEEGGQLTADLPGC